MRRKGHRCGFRKARRTAGRAKSSLLVAVVMAVLSAVVLGRILALRIEQGDTFAPYSSLRADPLGTKVLYESLRSLDGLTTARNFKVLDASAHAARFALAEQGPLTLLCLGASVDNPDEAPASVIAAFEQVAAAGGRVVVAFAPVGEAPPEAIAPPEDFWDIFSEDDTEESEDEDDLPSLYADGSVSLEQRWGVSLIFADLERTEDDVYRPTTAHRVGEGKLPESFPWHSATHFKTGDAWRTIYTGRGDRSAIIERPFGRGSLVLCGDAYLFSNEAMIRHREPDLLAWFTGTHSHIVFDESLLGVVERPGVMSLARRYRLHGVFAALLVLAALYVWRNAVPLVPPYSAAHGTAFSNGGKDSTAALDNLVRRGVPQRDLLQTCPRPMAGSPDARRA